MDDTGHLLLRVAILEMVLEEFVTQHGLTPMAQLAFQLRPDPPDDGSLGGHDGASGRKPVPRL